MHLIVFAFAKRMDKLHQKDDVKRSRGIQIESTNNLTQNII